MALFLVTGGCGFIGSHLADALIDRGDRVRILDNLSTGKLANKPALAEFIQGDVADPHVIAEAMESADGCFHLAAIASVERGNLDWIGTHRTNLTGTITIFDTARRVGGKLPIPVVYASSAAVYGDSSDLPLSEQIRPRPLSAYGADKLGCEQHGFVAGHVHQVPTTGLRFFNVYGPRQDPKSPYSGVISIFCDRLQAGQSVTIFGDGQQTRDFIFVGDVVRALLLAFEHASPRADVFNICTGVATSISDLAHTLGAIMGINPRIELGPARVGDIRASVGSPTKARTELSFLARTALPDGLRKTLDG